MKAGNFERRAWTVNSVQLRGGEKRISSLDPLEVTSDGGGRVCSNGCLSLLGAAIKRGRNTRAFSLGRVRTQQEISCLQARKGAFIRS